MIEIIHPIDRQVIQIEASPRGGIRIRSIVNSGRYDLYVNADLIGPLIKALMDFQSANGDQGEKTNFGKRGHL